MSVVELDDRGRLTLPRDLRRSMEVRRVVVINAGDYIKLIPIPEDPFEALMGALSSEKSFKNHRAEAERLAEEEARHSPS